jgi:hypothetical protein
MLGFYSWHAGVRVGPVARVHLAFEPHGHTDRSQKQRVFYSLARRLHLLPAEAPEGFDLRCRGANARSSNVLVQPSPSAPKCRPLIGFRVRHAAACGVRPVNAVAEPPRLQAEPRFSIRRCSRHPGLRPGVNAASEEPCLADLLRRRVSARRSVCCCFAGHKSCRHAW